jgi:hypothetical protein
VGHSFETTELLRLELQLVLLAPLVGLSTRRIGSEPMRSEPMRSERNEELD